MPIKKLLKDSQFYPFDWPLTGRVRTDVDPALIGETNFRKLQNMRYTADGVKGILGMSKVNASALAYTQVDGGFHFMKDIPAESHIFVQATSGANSKLYKFDNTADVPAQDTISEYLTLANNSRVYFANVPDGSMTAFNDTNNYIWGGNEARCGNFVVFDDSAATFWYDYTDRIINTMTDSANVATMTSDGSKCSVYIGSIRPLRGVKFYIGTANTDAATAAASYWDGSAWAAVSSLVDGTSAGGKTLAVTGSIAFTSTVSTAKVKVIRGIMAYFYKFEFTGLNSATTVSYCTLDAPMQAITDLWDANDRSCMRVLAGLGSGFSEYTTKVSEEGDYIGSSNPLLYAQFGSLSSSNPIYLGFNERMSGIKVSLPDASYRNTNAAELTVYYWDGTAWTTVGTIEDGTSVSGATHNTSGHITWNSPDESLEFKTMVGNQVQLYYYKIVTDNAWDADVRVDYIAGISAPLNIRPHRFAIGWQNRLWLCNDMTRKPNSIICSASGSTCVFNGDDSEEREFGGNEELVAGDTLFTRYGSNIYDNMVLLKRSSTYLIDGTGVGKYTTYTISDKVGCVAPDTLKKCDVSFSVSEGITKHILIWRSARSIEFFDSNSLSPISDDIASFFNPDSSDYIDPNVYDVSVEKAFYDEKNYEYHWIFTNADGRQEWVYNLRYRKWSNFNRGTGKALFSGFTVKDPNELTYTYGGGSDGYIQRLENGTTFDGNSIVYDMWFPDILLSKSGNYVTKIRHLKLFAKSKNTSTAKVTITHYADTDTTGTTVSSTVSQADSTKRLYQNKQSVNLAAVLHGLRYTVTTNNETIGFEPYLVGGLFELLREDI